METMILRNRIGAQSRLIRLQVKEKSLRKCFCPGVTKRSSAISSIISYGRLSRGHLNTACEFAEGYHDSVVVKPHGLLGDTCSSECCDTVEG